MAGDWIKMRVDLADDPAVVAMALKLGVEQDAIVGKLHRLWSWADKHTIKGRAIGITQEWIDRFVMSIGFASAMQKMNWLCLENDAVSFPRYRRHNGETAKKRALAQRRKALQRERQKRDESVTREEKRRVEKRTSKEEAPSAAALDASGAVIFIPLVSGEEFPVFPVDVSELGTLYPALDVVQTLREIRGWNLANPTRRKTRTGVMRHVHQWFAREQNKAPG